MKLFPRRVNIKSNPLDNLPSLIKTELGRLVRQFPRLVHWFQEKLMKSIFETWTIKEKVTRQRDNDMAELYKKMDTKK